MEIVEVIIVFFIALIIGAAFFYGLRRRGPWDAFWIFLLILILASWAGRLWIAPAGPLFWGYGWLPVVFWVFIFALLIAIASPSDKGRTVDYEPDTQTRITKGDQRMAATFGIFFWVLLFILIIAIIAGLLR